MEKLIDAGSKKLSNRRARSAKLRLIDSPALLELVAGWLSRKENYQWLNFAEGGQGFTPAWLKIMCQRDTDVLRLFTPDDRDEPIGVVGLTDIHRKFKTALLWVATGDKSFPALGYATLAASEILSYGFDALGLRAIRGWVVEGNPSIKILQRLGFNLIGRQRQCHCIDGRYYDRLLFDLLPSELKKP